MPDDVGWQAGVRGSSGGEAWDWDGDPKDACACAASMFTTVGVVGFLACLVPRPLNIIGHESNQMVMGVNNE